MSQTSILPGSRVTKDPRAKRPYQFDFDDLIAAGGEIVDQDLEVTGTDNDGQLTIDSVALASGSRKVNFRAVGGTLGVVYTVNCWIQTNETPVREEEWSFDILVANQ